MQLLVPISIYIPAVPYSTHKARDDLPEQTYGSLAAVVAVAKQKKTIRSRFDRRELND